jgi:hypothetical protein
MPFPDDPATPLVRLPPLVDPEFPRVHGDLGIFEG